MTPTSLEITGELPYADYEALGAFIGQLSDASNWWLADWLLYGEHTYGEKYAQAALVTRRSPQTLMNVNSIGKRFPPQRRVSGVTFSGHAEAAYLPPREQRALLAEAKRNGWSSDEIRAQVRATKEIAPAETCKCCGRSL